MCRALLARRRHVRAAAAAGRSPPQRPASRPPVPASPPAGRARQVLSAQRSPWALAATTWQLGDHGATTLQSLASLAGGENADCSKLTLHRHIYHRVRGVPPGSLCALARLRQDAGGGRDVHHAEAPRTARDARALRCCCNECRCRCCFCFNCVIRSIRSIRSIR